MAFQRIVGSRGQRFIVHGFGFVTQQESAGIGHGELTLLLDFKQLAIIVNSLYSKEVAKVKSEKNKAVNCLYLVLYKE